ncbi:hypothetical protein GVY41_15920 [Frigidibacter albus]|uniref:Lipoprotein n=1 Tax=Frigidibacter albus TaxID=1465486 RepID=A0A6L8VLF5_9RHOB|nr:hypothetical protein [Frigidibacter albus]MZQ90894.1 hypothetical protein [Frigidibacter albus]NBE32488.1 hypothetical protein [Frigidibacter albus]GGH61702.1 hypothetical protein GCM10011341_35190 [Frigidibacter albus]
MPLRPGYVLALAGLALASCGPIPVARAEAFCADRFATPPPISGRAKAGVSSNGGVVTDFEVEFAPSISSGDPSAAYTACVVRKSGEYPTRPLYQRGAAP